MDLPPPAPDRTRMFCFPYAGGGARSYESWIRFLPDLVDPVTVRLPGRDARFNDTFPNDLLHLAADIAGEIAPHLGPRAVLFGHSMGALMAFEVARALRRLHQVTPRALMVAAFEAPHTRRIPDEPFHKMSDQRLVDELAALGGMPALVREEPELLAVILPIIRGDLRLLEQYRYEVDLPLECPILAMAAIDDVEVSRDAMEPWAAHSTKPLVVSVWRGGHFFFEKDPELFAATVATHAMRMARRE